jgi:AraC family transcriptional regulator
MHESPAPHATLEKYLADTPSQVLATSQALGWNHASLLIVRQEAFPENVDIPCLEDDVINLLLEGSARARFRRIGGTSFDQYIGPPSLQVSPRHSEYAASWDLAWTYAVLRLNRQFVIETAAAIQYGDSTRIEFVPTFYFNDPLLYHLGVELCNETRSTNPHGALYAESLTSTLTLYLLRHYSTGRVVRDVSRSRLTSAQLRVIDEYIHTHLDQKFSVADLAACLHLSVPHFERMFRATTHRAPYHYALELRLERARLLLAHSRLSIAEVAYQCGFSSQSHFTAHFRRYIGISPARFVRDARQ